MRVHKLYIQFIKGIKEIQIYAKKSINEVAGPNESGKTTLLDSIKWAFGGKKAMDDKPVRSGKHEGSIILETDDGFTIRQRIKEDGKVTVSIRDKDGGIHGQSRLNQAFSKLSFDPLWFSSMKESERILVVESFAGEEFLNKKQHLQTQIENVFETRRMDKRILNEMGEPNPVEKAHPVDVDQIIAEGEDIDLYNEEVRKRNDKRTLLGNYIVNNEQTRIKIIQKINDLKMDLGKLELEQKELKRKVGELGEVEEMKSKAEFNRKLTEAADANAKALNYETYVKKMDKIEKLRKKIQTSTDTLEYLRESLSDHVSSVKLPVDGLTFDNKKVYVGGIPWDQLSMSERIRYSAYIGMALNKELKIMFVYDGSLLDDERMKVLTEIVEEQDYQLWIETVGKGRTEDAIILEAGEVKGAKGGSLDDKSST